MNRKEHLLTIFNEELGEVAKNVSKALRFGMDDRNVLEPNGPTNKERIIDELNDVQAMICLLIQEGLLPKEYLDPQKQMDKAVRVEKFLLYSKEKGTLE